MNTPKKSARQLPATLLSSNRNAGKQIGIDDQCEITKKDVNYTCKGTFKQLDFSDVDDFADNCLLSDKYTTKDVLDFGRLKCKAKSGKVVLDGREDPDKGVISVTRRCFEYAGPGIGFLDFDDTSDDPDEDASVIDAKLIKVAPWLGRARRIYKPSSSSRICEAEPDGKRRTTDPILSRKSSFHGFVGLDDMSKLPHIANALFADSVDAGYGGIKIGKNGTPYLRSLIDNAIYNPNRICYAFGPHFNDVEDRLYQDMEITRFGPVGALLRARDCPQMDEEAYRLWLASSDEVQRLFKAAEPECARVRAAYLERIEKTRGQAARAAVEHAMETEDLNLDFEFMDDPGETFTGAEYFDNPEEFPDVLDIRDPWDWSVRGKTQLYRNRDSGNPAVNAFHQGPKTYRLIDERADPFAALARAKGTKKPEGAAEEETAAPLSRDDIMRLIGKSKDIVGDAQSLVHKIAAAQLPEPESQALLNTINGASKRSIGISVLRNLYAEERTRLFPPGVFDDMLAEAVYTEDFNGGEDLLFAGPEGWFMWDGARWAYKGATAGELTWLDQIILTREKQIGVMREPKDNTGTFLNGVLRALKTYAFRQVEWYRGTIVNVKNGELHLIGGRWVLKPHNKRRYARSLINFDYVPGAACPVFTKAVNAMFKGTGDAKDRIRMLLEFMGVACVETAELDRMLIMVGMGANGKSVIMDLLKAMLGSNAASVRLKNFANQFHLAELNGKTANLDPEIKVGQLLADDVLKAVISGDTVDVAHKGLKPFEMKSSVTQISGANALPSMLDFSDAIFRRTSILKFERAFGDKIGEPIAPGSPRLADAVAVPGLKKGCSTGWLLEPELSAIMSRILDHAAVALNAGKIHKAPSSELAVREWANDHDQAAQWLGEKCVRSPSEEMSVRVAYADYRHWASDNGGRMTLNKVTFSKRVRDLLGTEPHRSGGENIIKGANLRANAAADNVIPMQKPRKK